jgi:hypothetical protein
VCPIGCLSHLDVEYDFAARREGVVAHIVVVQVVQKNGEDYQSLSTI